MRTAFIRTLTEMASADQNLYLLTGDVGYSVFEPFARMFPDRFLNLGIAEGNMIGVAAGLAMSGKNVYVYSMVPFITMRCLEQIRIDLCYQRIGVTVVGVGGGLSYGPAGATHHAIEDIAIMRALPNMVVVCPGDPLEAEFVTRESAKSDGPVYIRLGKNGEPKIHESVSGFKIGQAVQLSEGQDLTIIVTGNMLESAVQVSGRLKENGLGVRLVSMHTVKPVDQAMIDDCMKHTRYLFTLEEHNVIGGLGSAVAEVVAENASFRTPLTRIGIPDQYAKDVGSQDYLRTKCNLAVEQIYQVILNSINNFPGDGKNAD
jgi:transketolase